MVKKKKINKRFNKKVYVFIALLILLIILGVALMVTLDQTEEKNSLNAAPEAESLSTVGYVSLTIVDPSTLDEKDL